MQVRFVGRRELAPDVMEFVFEPERAVEYVPGQYARFSFPFHIDDPRGKQHRTFSFTSHPSDKTISTIIRFDQPLSIYKEHLLRLEAGDTMHIDEPHGDAILPRVDTTPLVFVAQGIAIASYVSMLREVAASSLAHPISLFWTKRASDAGLETLITPEAKLRMRSDIIYPDRLTIDQLTHAITDKSLVYLSGSQTFVETIGEALEASGTPRERIIYDYDEGYPDL